MRIYALLHTYAPVHACRWSRFKAAYAVQATGSEDGCIDPADVRPVLERTRGHDSIAAVHVDEALAALAVRTDVRMYVCV